jgi:hypothetical protein
VYYYCLSFSIVTSKLKKMGATQSKLDKTSEPRIFFKRKPLTVNQLCQTTSPYSQTILRDYKEALDIFNSNISQLNERNTVILEAIENPVLSPKDRKSLKNSVAALLNQKAKLLRIHENLLKSCADEASKIYKAYEYALSIARSDRMVNSANLFLMSDSSDAIRLLNIRMEKLNEKLIKQNNDLVDQHIDLDAQYSAIWEKYNIVL